MRGGKVGSRAGLAGKKDPVVDRRRQHRTIVGPSRQRVGVGAARQGIRAPLVRTARRDAAREVGAEQTDEFGYGKIQEGRLAALFELGRQRAAEIAFDQRPAERAELIRGGRRAIVGPKGAAVRIERLRIGKREEQLVREP